MKYVGFIIVILGAIILLIPLCLLISGSFQTNDDLSVMPPSVFNKTFTLENYARMFKYPVWRWLRNSILISTCSVCLSVPINVMAGYAFAKKKFRGKEILFGIFLFTMVIPGQITLIPSFLLMRYMGIYNTLLAMWLPSGVSAFILFFFRQYLTKIPDELLDMATIDGAGEVTKFIKIIVPLAAPAIVTMAILHFVGAWGGFLWQMLVVSRTELYTLPVGTTLMIYAEARNTLIDKDYAITFAAAVFAFIPVLLIFIFGQRYYMHGLFAGSTKG